MAKSPVTIKLTFDYDPDENNGVEPRVFLYQLLNRLNYEHKIKSIEYKGKTMTVKGVEDIKDLPLKKVDSIEKKDLPIVDKTGITEPPTFLCKENIIKLKKLVAMKDIKGLTEDEKKFINKNNQYLDEEEKSKVSSIINN